MDDLPSFKPVKGFFINEAQENRVSAHGLNLLSISFIASKGVDCRFGTRGVIAESHYDGGRNFIAMLKGAIIPLRIC